MVGSVLSRPHTGLLSPRGLDSTADQQGLDSTADQQVLLDTGDVDVSEDDGASSIYGSNCSRRSRG